LNIAQALLDALKARGAREIFGIPGDFALPFFKVIEESGTLPLYCRECSLPVYLELPRDCATLACEPVPPDSISPADSAALAACAEDVLAHLATATSPVLMVGVEIRRYGIESKVAELARRLGLPVVTSFMGHGLLAEGMPAPLGTYMGLAGDDDITRLVEDSDGLLLLGVILSDINFGASRRAIDLRRTIQALGGQVSLGYHAYPDIPIVAFVDGHPGAARQGGRRAAAAHTCPCPPARLPRRLGRR
jgi:indolepyruvate decarboxylase